MTSPVLRKIPEGQWTTTIYTMIGEGKHQEVVLIIEAQLELFPMNRAALSLLGYCYYYLQDFQSAAMW
jgi:tetratricopeptide repeat protein 30